jgi:hypothetical protein
MTGWAFTMAPLMGITPILWVKEMCEVGETNLITMTDTVLSTSAKAAIMRSTINMGCFFFTI